VLVLHQRCIIGGYSTFRSSNETRTAVRSGGRSPYRAVRLAALQATEDLASPRFVPTPVHLNLIAATALEAFGDQWQGHPSRRYAWPWPTMVDDIRESEAARFEVAVWGGDALCGLAIGRTRQTFCRVDYLEGSPVPNHPLRGSVAVLVSGAVIAYATALGREEIRLVDPIPEVVPYYETLGFSLANTKGQTSYCSSKVP
jgi:hypothetical protein